MISAEYGRCDTGRHTGRAGERIVFHHAEVLLDGELYTKPLRSARQQAVYICKEGEQKYSPRMTYMGFRYVGVSGIPVDRIKLKAVALYSDLPKKWRIFLFRAYAG